MPDAQDQQKNISDILNRFKSGVIALQANPSYDGVAAATALYLALTKMGKSMSIVCATKPQSDLMGADKIQNSLSAGGNHLVISFPYREGAIDKVDYNIASNTFNLIIIPNAETQKINPQDVKFSYTGGKTEFIFTVDVPNLNSLGGIYTENQNEFQGKNIINVDRHLINNNFGSVNMVNKQISSTSELILSIIESLNIELDKDIATNIYNGMLSATNNFSSFSVNPMTFEAAAKLMKLGAVKKQIPQPQGMQPMGGMNAPRPAPFGGYNAPGGMQPMNPMGMQNYEDMPAPMPRPPMSPNMQPMRPQQPMGMPQQPQGMPHPQSAPQGQPQNMPQSQQQGGQQAQPKSPQDWLKPKLFGGNNLI